MENQALPQLEKGDKIIVRCKDPRSIGFVAHAGRFERWILDRHGEAYAIGYDWCGMFAQYRFDQVSVAKSDAPFRLY